MQQDHHRFPSDLLCLDTDAGYVILKTVASAKTFVTLPKRLASKQSQNATFLCQQVENEVKTNERKCPRQIEM